MVTIDVLPDEVLLAIFDFYVVPYQDVDLFDAVFGEQDAVKRIESWQSLVHVCRRWRGLVFGSPRRLNLQLYYDSQRSARKTLVDVWPALPLLIQGYVFRTTVDNVIAELEHRDHICQISLGCYTASLIEIEKLWTAMQVPFPELARLRLSCQGPYVPVLPDSFLGGSAPHLQYLALYSIPFPALPKLLSSATHLVYLYLDDIPHSGYFSPEAMATCLSMLTSLRFLRVDFESPRSSPNQENRRSPPPTRSVFPALSEYEFKGVNEYLEEFVARIDAPRLSELSVTLFNDIDLDTPELIQFISRSPTFKAPNKAHVCFDSRAASVKLRPQGSRFEVKISCREPVWQLSSLAQICTTSSPLLSTTENLFISEGYDSLLEWKDGIENIEWMELLLPFTAVKNLYLSKQFAPHIALVLQEMTVGGTTEVLTTLQNLYLEGFRPSESVEEGIERFISARQLTDHPVAVSIWDRDLVSDESGEVDDWLQASSQLSAKWSNSSNKQVRRLLFKKIHKSTATRAEVPKSLRNFPCIIACARTMVIQKSMHFIRVHGAFMTQQRLLLVADSSTQALDLRIGQHWIDYC